MSEQSPIASMRLIGIFGHQELLADFKPGLNLLHGKNGTGKTTLLHVLANLLEGDLYRFCKIRFRRMVFRLYDDTEIVLEREIESELPEVSVILRGKNLGKLSPDTPVPELIANSIRDLFPTRPVYLPAFRSILEAADEREQLVTYRETIGAQTEFVAIKTSEERYIKDRRQRTTGKTLENPSATAAKTILSRRWFGEFVPIVRYPSVADVSRQLKEEFDHAYFAVNRKNQETFATVFSEVLQVLEKRVPDADDSVLKLLHRVQKHLEQLAPKDQSSLDESDAAPSLFESENQTVSGEADSIRAILMLYDSALTKRASREEDAYRGLRLLEDSFNRFIAPKALLIVRPSTRGRRAPTVTFPSGYEAKLGVLSSGERQVLTMLFCATHMSPADGTMLIDEPEISLHVDWQRIILNEIMRQAGSRQIIVCTHAPEVVAEHRNALISLGSKTWAPDSQPSSDSESEAETSS